MKKIASIIPQALCAAALVVSVSSCSEEEITPREAQPAATEATSLQVAMTITGVYTSYKDVADCKTCSYVVPEDVDIVDGEKLGLKPGAVICLDAARKYGDIEFVNLVGSETKPITIGSASFQ